MKENAKTYIISELTNIVKEFSLLKIFYKYDSFSKEHLIKVLPLEEYRNNNKFQKLEEEILFDFISKYPYDSLVFLSENDWIDIDVPDEIFKGENYIDENKQSQILETFFDEFLNSSLFTFTNIEEDILNVSEILDIPSSSGLFFDIIKENTLIDGYLTKNKSNDSNEHTIISNNYDYAIAA